MTKKDEKYILNIIFEAGISGANSNSYIKLVDIIESLPVEMRRMNFSLESLYKVLVNKSNKWDKEIDEYLDL